MKNTLNRFEWWFRSKCSENFLLSGSLFDGLMRRVHLNLFFVWNDRAIHRYMSTPKHGYRLWMSKGTIFSPPLEVYRTSERGFGEERVSNPIRNHGQGWIWNRWKTALCTQSWTEKQQCSKYQFTRTNLSPMMQNLVSTSSSKAWDSPWLPPSRPFPSVLCKASSAMLWEVAEAHKRLGELRCFFVVLTFFVWLIIV